MHFAGFSLLSRKNMKSSSISGFSRDLESWIDPMSRRSRVLNSGPGTPVLSSFSLINTSVVMVIDY